MITVLGPMVTTRGPRSPSPVHRPPLGGLQVLCWLATLTWALEVVLPRSVTPALLVGALVGCASVWWRTSRTATMRRRARTVHASLAAHRDPGPETRAAVDERARDVLARLAIDPWIPALLGVVLAAACGVLAVVRGDGTTALPALPLLVLAALSVASTRRQLLQASRWLDDPPYDRADRV